MAGDERLGLESLARAWSEMEMAARAIVCSQPREMTAASERLEKALVPMRKAVMGLLFPTSQEGLEEDG